MHKILKITLLFFAITFTSFAQEEDAIIGRYLLPNQIEIEVFKENNLFSAKIVALNNYKNGQTKDVKNATKSKRKDLLLGKVVLTNLVFDSTSKQWKNGKMYTPDKGITVNLKVTKINKKEVTVVGSKYFFWRTITWKKIEN